MTFDEYKKFVSEYTAEKVSKLSGVPEDKLEALAKLYIDPKTKVTSFWTMGFNQHTRGTWANNLIYNIHLLTGKISEPGNSPFSLTGQPSACGTAREVGTFAHRLPADMVVMNKEHRDIAEKIWKLPTGTIPDKPGFHAVLMQRMLKDKKMNVYWQQCNNNMQAGPNINDEMLPGWRDPENFIIVSDPYPTVSALAADLILPTAMWVEKEGAYGNAERRTQFWRQQVKAPGQAQSDMWQVIEFSKRFKVEEVWPKELLAKKPQYKGKTLYDVLFANGVVNKYPVAQLQKGYDNDEAKHFGFYVQKGLFEEYASFGRDHGHDLAPFDIQLAERLQHPACVREALPSEDGAPRVAASSEPAAVSAAGAGSVPARVWPGKVRGPYARVDSRSWPGQGRCCCAGSTGRYVPPPVGRDRPPREP